MSRLVVFSFVGLLVLSSCGGRYAFEMSRNYTPVYNPGGDLFGEDEGFAQSYEIYEKRRNDVLQDQADARRGRAMGADKSRNRGIQKISNEEKEEVEEQLRRYGALPRKATKRSKGMMVNKEGVDLSQIKGARFIDILIGDDGESIECHEKSRSVECAHDCECPPQVVGMDKEGGCEHGRKRDHVHLECDCGSLCDCPHCKKNANDKGGVRDSATGSTEEEHGIDKDSVLVGDERGSTGGLEPVRHGDWGIHSEDGLDSVVSDLDDGDRGSDFSDLKEGQGDLHGGSDVNHGEQQREVCSCDDEWCSSCYDAGVYGTGIEEEYDVSDDDLTGCDSENGVFVPGTKDATENLGADEGVLPGEGTGDETLFSDDNCGNEERDSVGPCDREGSDVSCTRREKGDYVTSPKQDKDDSYPLGFENDEFVVSSGDDEDVDFTALQEDRLVVEGDSVSGANHDDDVGISAEDEDAVDLVHDKDDIDEEDDWSDDEEEDFDDYEDEDIVQRKENVVPQVGGTKALKGKESASPSMNSSAPTVSEKEKIGPGYSGLPGYDEDDDDDRYSLPISGGRTRFYDFGSFVDDTFFP
ncbi:MAG: TRP75-related protein [Aaplasma endosymbiont of Hyalomma asiaticum]